MRLSLILVKILVFQSVSVHNVSKMSTLRSDEPTKMKMFAESSEFLEAGGKCRDSYSSGQNVSWKS